MFTYYMCVYCEYLLYCVNVLGLYKYTHMYVYI